MNLPNILTVFRLVLTPIFIISYFGAGNSPVKIVCLIIFVLAAITDVLDGFIARRFNLVTKFGKLADPLADKLMQLSALSCLAFDGRIKLWILIVFAVKEIILILGSLNLLKSDFVVQSRWTGKISTIVLFLCVSAMLLFDKNVFPDYYVTVAMTFSIIVTIVAFFDYALTVNSLKKQSTQAKFKEKM